MNNIDRILNNLPVEPTLRPLCALTLEMVKEQPNPLSLLLDFPYESQWLDKEAWQWLEYQLMHEQGKRYTENGDLKAFTAQAAYKIASGMKILDKSTKFVENDRATHKRLGTGTIIAIKEQGYVHFLPDAEKITVREGNSISIETIPGVLEVHESSLEFFNIEKA